MNLNDVKGSLDSAGLSGFPKAMGETPDAACVADCSSCTDGGMY